MALIDCNADEHANDLFISLTADSPTPTVIDFSGEQFNFVKDTTSELYTDFNSVTLEELTEVDLEGSGVFDKLMRSMDLHIQREFKGNRITGDQYAKVYVEIATAVLGQSVAFLLQRDQAKWNAITAQMQARIAEIKATEALIELEKVKIDAQKSVFDMKTSGAQYALTKMQTANADATYCLTQGQTELVIEQRETQRSQTLDTRADGTTPVGGLVGKQKNLIQEQTENERSKTMNTRSDGTTVILGSVGKQKDLYDQQIDSFVKDAKQKAAKMYLDGWITQKTLDENLAAPTELEVPSVSAVLLALRNENGL